MIRSTSKKAHREIIESGSALTQKERILTFIETQNAHDKYPNSREIQRALKLDINAVSARVNFLKNEEAVFEYDKQVDKRTNKLVYCYIAKKYYTQKLLTF